MVIAIFFEVIERVVYPLSGMTFDWQQSPRQSSIFFFFSKLRRNRGELEILFFLTFFDRLAIKFWDSSMLFFEILSSDQRIDHSDEDGRKENDFNCM